MIEQTLINILDVVTVIALVYWAWRGLYKKYIHKDKS